MFEAKSRIFFCGTRRLGFDTLDERLRTPPVFAANEIDRAAVDERQKPCAGLATFGHEAVGVPPRSEKTLLDGILGQTLVAEDPQGEPICHPAEAVIELCERRLV